MNEGLDLVAEHGAQQLKEIDGKKLKPITKDGFDLVDEYAVQHGSCVAHAANLRELAIRLATFDAHLERLRVGRDVWAVLTRGLGVLTRHQNIRSLELSFVTRKHMTEKFTELSSETDEIENSCIEPSRSASLLEVFGSLSSLEELVLTHNEIQGPAALKLAQSCSGLDNLKRQLCAASMLRRQKWWTS